MSGTKEKFFMLDFFVVCQVLIFHVSPLSFEILAAKMNRNDGPERG